MLHVLTKEVVSQRAELVDSLLQRALSFVYPDGWDYNAIKSKVEMLTTGDVEMCYIANEFMFSVELVMKGHHINFVTETAWKD